MFGSRKEERELFKKTLESVEQSQKNTEMIVSAVCQMVEEKKSEKLEETDALSDAEKEEMQRRVAYALNLCTVSVSQIIDYNDENILEQEYETILNNLNLENMPKDEALLNILKQILDTVTFFRIQKGDKEFIDKEYQHKMKNAIWSGIPNFGLIVAGGNPFTMAVSLASQVGIGYMNYRKSKAENILSKEKQEWQLQRAAIEQLNGLRRELFDCAWRLSERHGFKDKYRLTERQITQYNNILMDTDDVRRYERLDSVRENFFAYPSFWYHFGHAANAIAQQARIDNEIDIYNKYRELAISHFDYYMKSDKYTLLREDQITSSCALEYIELLDVNEDRDEIKKLLSRAIEMSGKACDVLQLCAIAYLRISDIVPAIELLQYLVNEKYNAVTNAQLLSSIYVSGLIENNVEAYKVEYRMLERKVPSEFLFPFPANGESIDDLKEEFIEKQQEVLLQRYGYVIRCFYEKCSVLFNQSIPVPDETKKYEDAFFSDLPDFREERLKQYKTLFSNKNKADDYLFRLSNANFALSFLDVLNDMVNSIENILPGDIVERRNTLDNLAGLIEKQVLAKRDVLNHLQEKMNSYFSIKEFETLFDLSFDVFVKEFYGALIMLVKQYCQELRNMAEFSAEETMLNEFCIKQGIPEFKIYVGNTKTQYEEFTGKKTYFSSELLGGKAFERSEMLALARRMEKCIESECENIIITGNKKNTYFGTKWSKSLKLDYDEYFRKGKKKYYNSNKYIRDKIFAVLVNKLHKDLIFTTEGIICDDVFTGWSANPKVVKYADISNDNDGLKIGDAVYKNKGINMMALFDLIQEFAEMASEISESESTRESYIETQSPYRIEGEY